MAELDYEALWKLAVEKARDEAMLMYPLTQPDWIDGEVKTRAMIYYRQMTRRDE